MTKRSGAIPDIGFTLISFRFNIITIENKVEELQKLYLDEEIKNKIENIKQRVILYQSGNVELMKLKEQIKSIKGVEDEIERLSKEGIRNTKLQEEIVSTLEEKEKSGKNLNKINIDIEILKDKISSFKG